MKTSLVEEAYEIAKAYYSDLGYDTDSVIAALPSPPRCPYEGHEDPDSLLAYVTDFRQQQRQAILSQLGGDVTYIDAVYDEHCLRWDVPVADEYIADVERHINIIKENQ